MKKTVKSFCRILFISAALIPALHAQEKKLVIENPEKQIQRMIDLNVSGIKVVEADGQIMFISHNGRYVITGSIVDIWQRKELNTMNQIDDSVNRLHLQKMGAKLEILNSASFGNGPENVIFVDPKCSICHKLLTDAQKLSDKYSFRFVVVPALGKDSDVLSRKFFCADANATEKTKAFMNQQLASIKQRNNCDTANYDQTLYTADLLQIKGVPFLVAHDGRISKGAPADLMKFLENK